MAHSKYAEVQAAWHLAGTACCNLRGSVTTNASLIALFIISQPSNFDRVGSLHNASSHVRTPSFRGFASDGDLWLSLEHSLQVFSGSRSSFWVTVRTYQSPAYQVLTAGLSDAPKEFGWASRCHLTNTAPAGSSLKAVVLLGLLREISVNGLT
jgi:hypothetical protein